MPPTDHSGTITTGGTSQELMPARDARIWLFIQNLSTENLWIDFDTPAVASQPSIQLTAGSAIEFSGGSTSWVPEDAINIIGATTGSAFVAKEV